MTMMMMKFEVIYEKCDRNGRVVTFSKASASLISLQPKLHSKTKLHWSWEMLSCCTLLPFFHVAKLNKLFRSKLLKGVNLGFLYKIFW